jgi:hypothetical protein
MPESRQAQLKASCTTSAAGFANFAPRNRDERMMSKTGGRKQWPMHGIGFRHIARLTAMTFAQNLGSWQAGWIVWRHPQ